MALPLYRIISRRWRINKRSCFQKWNPLVTIPLIFWHLFCESRSFDLLLIPNEWIQEIFLVYTSLITWWYCIKQTEKALLVCACRVTWWCFMPERDTVLLVYRSQDNWWNQICKNADWVRNSTILKNPIILQGLTIDVSTTKNERSVSSSLLQGQHKKSLKIAVQDRKRSYKKRVWVSSLLQFEEHQSIKAIADNTYLWYDVTPYQRSVLTRNHVIQKVHIDTDWHRVKDLWDLCCCRLNINDSSCRQFWGAAADNTDFWDDEGVVVVFMSKKWHPDRLR